MKAHQLKNACDLYVTCKPTLTIVNMRTGEIMKIFFQLTILLFSLVMSTLVMAERADKDKPIELEADSVIVDDAKKISTYIGNVILTQGTLVIRAAKLIVREDRNGFQHSTSTGSPTTFKQKREGKNEYMSGSARRIEYDGRMDKVQLYTKAWVKRGEDIIYGDYISYDANAEYAEVMGGKKSGSDGQSSGRVKAIIQPKNKSSDTDQKNSKPTPSSSNKEPGKPVKINKLKLSDSLTLPIEQ